MAVKKQANPKPETMTAPDSSRGLDRLGVARLGSIVGALALIVAVIALLAQGDATPLVVGSALLAAIGIGLWVTLAPDDFRATISGRRAVYGTNSALVTILVAGSAIIVYTLANGSGVAADFTTAGYYQLKPNVRPVLDSLTRPIQITAFYSRQLLGQQSAEVPLLRMFQDAAPDMVRIAYVDPDEQPLVASQFGLQSNFGVFVSYLTDEGLPDPRFTVQMRPDMTYVNERWVAESILQLQARGLYKVVFTVGGDEMNIDADATGIRDGLKSVGITVDKVDLTNAEIPADTTVLVILAPRRDFTQPEVDKIAAFTERGGKLLLMAEPAYEGSIRFMQQAESPLAVYLWKVWGVRPQRDIVVDPVAYYDNIFYVRPAKFANNHPIVNKDESGTPARPLFSIVQSWEIAPTPPDGVNVTPLYTSSDSSFGRLELRNLAMDPDRTTRTALELAGPLTLAAAAENTNTGARLIVVGDSDWVLNDLIESFDGQYLWTNMMDWLTQFLKRITVNPVSVTLPLNVSSTELNIAAVITLVILPGVVLLAGAWVWWRRARR